MAIRDVVAKYVLKGEDETSPAFKSASKAADKAAEAAKKYGTLAGGAAAAGIAILTKRSLDNIDALAKQSDAMDIAIEDLQAYKHLAELTGGEGDRFVDVLREMNIRLGEAATGSGEAAGMIKTLGLDLDALLQMNPSEQMQTLSGAIANLETSAQKSAAANKLFGGSAVDMLDTIEAIPGGLQDARDELDALGVSVTRIDAAKVEAANDSFTRIGSVVEGLGNQIAVGVAPVLEALTNRFVDSAKEAGGFSNIVQTGMEVAAKSIGIAADGLHGMEIIWNGLKAAASGAILIIVEGLEQLLQQLDIVLGSVNAGINLIIRSVNAISDLELPELDTSPLAGSIEFVDGISQSLADNVKQATDEMHALAMEPLPSENVHKFFEDVQRDAEEAARKAVEAKEAITGTGGFADVGADEAAQKAREQAESQLAGLEEFLGRQEMAINLAFENRREIVQTAFENQLIDEERRNQILEDLAAKHQEQLTKAALEGMSEREKFNKLTWDQQVETTAGALADMTAGVANESKAMFQINKAAGIANAIINTSQGVTRALAEYPPPLSFVMAAAQLAAGLAQVNAIRGAQFGGGTTPSVAGSTPTFNGQPVGRGGQGGEALPSDEGRRESSTTVREIRVQGLEGDGIVSKRDARAIIDAINEEAGDGVRILNVRAG